MKGPTTSIHWQVRFLFGTPRHPKHGVYNSHATSVTEGSGAHKSQSLHDHDFR